MALDSDIVAIAKTKKQKQKAKWFETNFSEREIETVKSSHGNFDCLQFQHANSVFKAK